jgi:hypothetical protein
MIECVHCSEVNSEYEIISPSDFHKVLQIVRDNLSDGTLVESQYWPEGEIRTCTVPFDQVSSTVPYQQDIYIYYFHCPECRRLYRLSCDTYHGSGGSWEALGIKY